LFGRAFGKKDDRIDVTVFDDLKKLDKLMARFFEVRKPLASTINILAGALYSVFSATDDPSLPVMQKACFDYFKLGGIAVSGPMSLLSGMKPSPATLIFHFFSVAVFGCLQALKPFPTPGRILLAIRVLMAANRIVQPLIKAELRLKWKPVA
jgi:squalene monooxygenase